MFWNHSVRLFTLLTCLLICFSSTARARLGETENELIKRFGSPTSRGSHSASFEGRRYDLGPTMRFRQDDWSISCDLIDGRCVRVSYGKTGSWTQDQISAVLNANAQGDKWTETTAPNVKGIARTWKRGDGAIASWNVVAGLTMTSPVYERAKAVAEAKANRLLKNTS
jgi:hypothetical protein